MTESVRTKTSEEVGAQLRGDAVVDPKLGLTDEEIQEFATGAKLQRVVLEMGLKRGRFMKAVQDNSTSLTAKELASAKILGIHLPANLLELLGGPEEVLGMVAGALEVKLAALEKELEEKVQEAREWVQKK